MINGNCVGQHREHFHHHKKKSVGQHDSRVSTCQLCRGQWVQSHSMSNILVFLKVLQWLVTTWRRAACSPARTLVRPLSQLCLWSECPRRGSAIEPSQGCPAPQCFLDCYSPALSENRGRKLMFTDDQPRDMLPTPGHPRSLLSSS